MPSKLDAVFQVSEFLYLLFLVCQVSLTKKLNRFYGENLHFKKARLTILSSWLDLSYFSPLPRSKGDRRAIQKS